MSDFDRNFKIKVDGSWCEYQRGRLIDLRKIRQVVSYRGEMGWPFKFYFTDGDYVYVQRAEIGQQIEQALKDLSGQQSKIEQLEKEKAELKKRIEKAIGKWMGLSSIATTQADGLSNEFYMKLDGLHDALTGFDEALRGE